MRKTTQPDNMFNPEKDDRPTRADAKAARSLSFVQGYYMTYQDRFLYKAF